MLLGKVRRTICRYSMVCPGHGVIVAVSGGPDSVALLHLLWRLRPEYDLKLWVAHLNHQLRGKESKEDARFVVDLAQELGLPTILGSEQVRRLCRERKVSLEEGARIARYRFLNEAAVKVGADRIATGHTMDDQAETIIMHLIRGAGATGLSGIKPVRERLIRPLLEVSRCEIEEYLRLHGLRARQDSSNRDRRYLRNRVRLDLIPLLRKYYNPQVVSSLARAGRLLAADDAHLAEIAHGVFKTGLQSHTMDKIVLDLRTISRYNRAIQLRVVRLAHGRLTKKDLSLEHCEQIIDLVEESGTGARRLLTGGVTVERSWRWLIFYREEPHGYQMEVKLPGRVKIPGSNDLLEGEMLNGRVPPLGNDPHVAYLDGDTVSAPLVVRSRRRGDRFTPLGMRGRKRLKDFFVERKVPRLVRDHVPLLTSRGKIVWVVGYQIDDAFKITNDTKRILKIRYRPRGNLDEWSRDTDLNPPGRDQQQGESDRA